MVRDIDDYARAVGMTRSALCAYFIGQGIFGIKKGVELSKICMTGMNEDIENTGTDK